jgi:uncharacterized protein YbbC (DUF1343 family)/CubicO group peptidase (beta-lactamase class C family)
MRTCICWKRLGLLVALPALLSRVLVGQPAIPPPTGSPLRSQRLAEMESAVARAVSEHQLPGGVLWLEHRGAIFHKAFGQRALVPRVEPMTEDTIFDAASLTKVVATAPAVLLLIERGQVELDQPARRYLPGFMGNDREAITVRHLLTHTSGLRPGLPRQTDWTGYEQGIRLALAERPTTPPGTAFRYSDINFILLGELVRQVSSQPLDEFAAKAFYQPLQMADTGFRPSAGRVTRIAPTERTGGVALRGVVHDPTARRMGGVAGHAGLFTTAADLARFARMMLNEGELDGVRVLQPETVRRMTTVQTPGVPERRGLGWDIDSPYAGPRGEYFPLGSYGHTGWTGGSIWIDPFSRTFLVFLSNRNHPTEAGSVLGLRRELGTLAAEAIDDFNFLAVPGALPTRTNAVVEAALAPAGAPRMGEVCNGIDVLRRQDYAPLKGLRVGLITNPTGHDRQRNPTIDLLKAAPGVQLRALFSPEHGLRGQLDAAVSDSVDLATGLPVFSLYGDTRKPRPQQLRDLDALVFDVQDIGCRFYTYISTLGLCLEAAAEAHVKFFVLDRANPINGVGVEGPVYAGPSSFTAFHALPLRHGMTAGELAGMFVAERKLAVDLTVIRLEGWHRELWLDETGLPWTNPSPNMRNLTQATLYPGVGLLETAVSVGRGTDTPFEVVGAPFVDDVKLAAELNAVGLPGVRFVPVRFTPAASVFKGQPCGGVHLIITDRDALNAVEVGLLLAQTFQRLYPLEFALEKVNALLQDRATLDAIRAGNPLAEIRQLWAKELEAFRQRRLKFLLYGA